jgi:hypothetical protein
VDSREGQIAASGLMILPRDSFDPSHKSIDGLRLSVRANHCLRASGIGTVEQLVLQTPTQLLRSPNLGRTTLREIEQALAIQGLSLGMCDYKIQATLDFDEPVEKCGSVELESNAVAADIRQEPAFCDPATAAAAQVLAYLEKLPRREAAILRDRILSSTRTLEELGQQFGVTRERIRQIETRMRIRASAYLASAAGAAAKYQATIWRTAFGTAVPKEEIQNYCRSLVLACIPSEEDQEFVLEFLLWASGPYVERDGWMIAAGFSNEVLIASLLQGMDERGWLSPTTASEILEGAGIREENHSKWLVLNGFLSMDGGWLAKLQSITDRAAQVLRYRRQPITAAEFCVLFKSSSERSLRNRLLDDERFKRISRHGHFALREWPEYDEYSGIAAEISEEIEKHGGQAQAQHLVEVISQRYGVKASSVYQYLSAPMFIKSQDGTVRLRKLDEALVVQSDPRICAGLYMVSGQWTLRLEINRDTLRGSGRPLQSAVAVLVGCQPGGRRVFQSPRDQVVISWPWGSSAGPNLGSLKPDVEALGGEAGDFVFLTPIADEMFLRVLRSDELRTAAPIVKLALLIGLPATIASEPERWAIIGSAIGLAELSSPLDAEDVHAALMRRNEVSLANLVREECPHPGKNIFDRLENLLGL